MRLQEVHFSYSPQAPVLREINLTIAPGERLILLGANGAGKSTLLSLLNGLLQPTAGSVHGDQRRVSTVLQDPDDQLFADTPLRDVALGLLEQGFDDTTAAHTARAALAQMGVEHLAARPIFSLSLGEKKRVALAGALVVRPEVLLLDEPTAALDPAGKREVEHLMAQFAQAGMTLIFASHNLGQVKRLADRVLYLEEGRLQVDWPAQRFFSDRLPDGAAAFLKGESV